jgi:hypothetical protein
MLTRRFHQTFQCTEKKDMHVYTTMFSTQGHQNIQYCGFSFSNDLQLKPLATVIEKITFSHCIPEMTGQTLMLRNGLFGFRTTYDKCHNRTHVPLFFDLPVNGDDDDPIVVTFYIRQLSSAELKVQGVKENSDLFREPELFVATQKTSNSKIQIRPSSQLSPIYKQATTIPFLTMNDIKTIRVPLPKHIPFTPHVTQMWFTYNWRNIRTTSSLFSKLELTHKNDVVHSYSSTVQLQIIDREIHKMFSPIESSRKAQEFYMTITFGKLETADLKDCCLVFHLHEQLYKDYTNWVQEDKNKLAEIKDAVVVIEFGFIV